MASQDAETAAEANKLPDEEHLKQAAASAQKALEAQGMAQKLKETASSITDPKKREKMLREAYDKEIEAHGNSKKARILQSGAFQGAAGGAGIGSVVGAGVGTLVGTVVGTVTAIPTTAVGGLVGSGVGAFHGPWIKLPPIGGGKGNDAKGNTNEKKAGKADAQKGGTKKAGKESNKDGKAGQDGVEDEEGMLPDPTALRQAADAVAAEKEKQNQPAASRDATGRRKPRKLEIRSQSTKTAEAGTR